MNRPVASVVDYEAWRKGYMPPTEHQLIDQLSYHGAKVVLSTQSDDFSFWFVVKQDGGLTKKQRTALLQLLEMTIDEIEDANDRPDANVHPLAAGAVHTKEQS